MRGISALYYVACEREGCLANSLFVHFCINLDSSDDCPKNIDLCSNYLGDAGCAAIIRTVAVMAWVHRVEMRGCGAGEKATRALVEVVADHPNLRCVDFRGENSTVFAVSGRLLLRLLARLKRLVVLVNYDDFPPTMANRLRAYNECHDQLQREEEEHEKAVQMGIANSYESLREEERIRNLLYIPTLDSDGNQLYSEGSDILHLVDGLNTHMEDYLEAYAYVGRAAAQLAIDLGPTILPCIRATAPAAPVCLSAPSRLVYPVGVASSLRAIDALFTGLRANPFLRQELEEARGSILGMYITKLQELRGEYESLVAKRMGPFPSYKEWKLEKEMRPLYNRIVAGITQGSMLDLPSMKHIEERLRELRQLVLDSLLEGRERALQVPLLQLRYFAYNHSTETKAWTVDYIKGTRAYMHQKQKEKEPKLRIRVDDDGDENEQRGKEDSGVESDEEQYDNEVVKRLGSGSPKHTRLCLKALRELREMISDPYIQARYAVTKALSDLLPPEFKFFLCDLVLRRAALLYTPRIFVLDGDDRRSSWHVQGVWNMGNESDDPYDIVGIFQRVLGRREFSEVLCAFEEWYRLHQVERYDITYVSRQELLAVMTDA
ncbi:hypothetical protein, conserved [Trypanosoma brucei gambiense DAL972]|uniref:Uncharacterized protein n=1 Tax=Trypanosoma brucei gambiense (strain MHOM/CI/86/DAL972) TaxID=679716 RepID=C9ZWA6_TRYB9|nr:hypothetical protein, conserved [Trypanosoma brucei gambiense DAL972]CBH13695.1 hypothetical protein, conserved [Trypanosoma brucei gambiense DAL972]|eukprot:XP_011775971.1 hypothetical protein, conserved [Trypanosoma brucei gambiense DAL972]